MGLVLAFEENENSILGYHDDPEISHGAVARHRRHPRRCSREKIEKYDIRPPNLPAEDGEFLRRQPAEDRAGARDRAGPGSADRRPADPRRRCRRHRIHPQAADPDARQRQGRAADLGRARRDPLAVRPHPGDVRRPHCRRARAGYQRRRARPADGRRRRSQGGRPNERALRKAARLGRLRADPADQPLGRLPGCRASSCCWSAKTRCAPRKLLVEGAFGYGEAIGYTLFYATSFIFTGLAVAIAFHAGLFNIGGEGQAYVGGLGVALACLAFDSVLPWWLVFPMAILAAAAVGGALGARAGLSAGQARQPHRHHHHHVQLHRRRASWSTCWSTS